MYNSYTHNLSGAIASYVLCTQVIYLTGLFLKETQFFYLFELLFLLLNLPSQKLIRLLILII